MLPLKKVALEMLRLYRFWISKYGCGYSCEAARRVQ